MNKTNDTNGRKHQVFFHKRSIPGYEFFDRFNSAAAAVSNLGADMNNEFTAELAAMGNRIKEIREVVEARVRAECDAENAKTVYKIRFKHETVFRGTQAECEKYLDGIEDTTGYRADVDYEAA